ncbi:lipoprotein [gut metagenome]|uniref:Lipoprotein n=1 Tax=gut metagenome TaxID=749906 RepID=J9GP13_9ZZZZ
MKFKYIAPLGCLAFATIFASCEKKQTEVKSNGAVPAKQAEAPALNIAYVELEALESQYQFFIETKSKLEARSKKYDQELNRLGQSLQKAGADFQQKIQQGKFTTQAEAEAAQKKLMNQQAQLEQKQMKYAQELAEEQAKFNEALQDSLSNFLNDYNKSHKYSMILSKAGGNILVADKSLDITADVISGLNQRYKKSSK